VGIDRVRGWLGAGGGGWGGVGERGWSDGKDEGGDGG